MWTHVLRGIIKELTNYNEYLITFKILSNEETHNIIVVFILFFSIIVI